MSKSVDLQLFNKPEKGGTKARGAKEEARKGGERKGKIERGEQALFFET